MATYAHSRSAERKVMNTMLLDVRNSIKASAFLNEQTGYIRDGYDALIALEQAQTIINYIIDETATKHDIRTRQRKGIDAVFSALQKTILDYINGPGRKDTGEIPEKKAETYREMKARQQAEVNDFPMYWAFSEEQLQRQLQELGLDKETWLDKVKVIGTGGFVLKQDYESYRDLMNRHTIEREDAIAADPDGTGFIFQMFRHELANHEYSYTGDTWETLEALGIREKDLNESPALRNGLALARKACMKEDE